jgi:hypothetical protein
VKPSIDLAAELESITRRQHLNDVHFAVALVRHAMRARPRRVELRISKRALTVSHDGAPLDDDERRLLLTVLSTRPDDERQHALADLEGRFGVALLSALATSDRGSLESRASLDVEGGLARPSTSVRDRGYVLTLRRPIARPRDARRELAFYCAHAPIPVVVDGKDITRPLQLRETVIRRRFKGENGDGMCGLPRQRALSRVRYYKHGVYFGVRSSLPSDGRAVEAMYNSTLDEVEDNFRRSINAANRALREARRALYDDAADGFAAASEADKDTLARAFLRVPPKAWTDPMRAAPFLHTTDARWSRSLDSVVAEGAHGIVPYTLRADPSARGLLLLTPDEVRAVRKLTGVKLRRALAAPPAPPAPPPAGASGLPPQALEPDVRALVAALAAGDTRLVVTDGAPPATSLSGRVRVVELPRGHPALSRAAAYLRANPRRADVAALALVGAADPLAAN